VSVAASLFAALGGGVHGAFLFPCSSSGQDGIVVVLSILSVTVEPSRGGVTAACPKQSCDRWLARFQQFGCSLELRLFAAGPMSRHSHKIVAGVHLVHGGVDFFLTTHPTSRQESLYALQPNLPTTTAAIFLHSMPSINL
jgi:hypothetical protein